LASDRVGANSVVRTGSGCSRCPTSRRRFHTRLAKPAASTPDQRMTDYTSESLVLFFVFICQNRLEGTTMQIQFDDVGSGKRLALASG